jgi:hypothetical protein
MVPERKLTESVSQPAPAAKGFGIFLPTCNPKQERKVLEQLLYLGIQQWGRFKLLGLVGSFHRYHPPS